MPPIDSLIRGWSLQGSQVQLSPTVVPAGDATNSYCMKPFAAHTESLQVMCDYLLKWMRVEKDRGVVSVKGGGLGICD